MGYSARLSLFLSLFLLPACGDGGDPEGDALAHGVAVERRAPPGPGESGPSITYSNGHPLDWLTDEAAVLSFEDQVLTLVNERRTSLGLSPLADDPGLRRCARGHSRHMRPDAHAFVAHVNPEGHGPGERMLICGVPGGLSAGENAAAGLATPFDVFNAWMNSAPHRANIEEPSWRRSGVGYQPGPPGDALGHYWSQLFSN